MKYKNKLDLYESTFEENALGEKEKVWRYKKTVYCNIAPFHGGTSSIGGTDVKSSYTIQRITLRKFSIKAPKIDMYFLDLNGHKYEVLDFFPNYKNNDEWDFRTHIIREV